MFAEHGTNYIKRKNSSTFQGNFQTHIQQTKKMIMNIKVVIIVTDTDILHPKGAD